MASVYYPKPTLITVILNIARPTGIILIDSVGTGAASQRFTEHMRNMQVSIYTYV